MKVITAEHFADYELEDNSSPYGGISFIGETLADFLEEIGKSLTSSMKDVNRWLNQCGIKSINIKNK